MNEKNLEEASTPKGLIVYSDRHLRYEGGLKAWFALGPVILGAGALEAAITSRRTDSHHAILLWFVFLAYLVVFPPAWNAALSFFHRKLVLDGDDHPSASTNTGDQRAAREERNPDASA